MAALDLQLPVTPLHAAPWTEVYTYFPRPGLSSLHTQFVITQFVIPRESQEPGFFSTYNAVPEVSWGNRADNS